MDLLAILRKSVESLPEGAHLTGLRSVLRHIETAEAHLLRGQELADETAFTDAIYRTNQAFEGGIKEAYRVLAGKDPAKTEPFKIEKYLQDNSVFKDRVLSQFKNYRTEWRNPSTHDYNLDFDSSEALLAIANITTFTKLLVDQIETRLAYEELSQELVDVPPVVSRVSTKSTLDRVAELALAFLRDYAPSTERPSISETEARFTGAFLAYLSAAAPDLQLMSELSVDPMSRGRVDVAVKSGGDLILIEIKGAYRRVIVEQAIEQMRSYILGLGASGALLLFRGKSDAEWVGGDFTRMELVGLGARTLLIGPPRSEEYWVWLNLDRDNAPN